MEYGNHFEQKAAETGGSIYREKGIHMKEKQDGELGRYQKKIADQTKEIRELKEKNAGWEEVQRLNEALLACVLKQLGADGENPAAVSKADLQAALSEFRIASTEKEEKDGYLLYVTDGMHHGG